MPAAEIDFPGPGGIVGPTFPAGGVYDLSREKLPPGSMPPEPLKADGTIKAVTKIRCRVHNAAGMEVAVSSDSATLVGNTGPWSVNFTNVPGPYPRNGHKVTSYIVYEDGTDQASQIVLNITINDGAAGGGGGSLVVVELP